MNDSARSKSKLDKFRNAFISFLIVVCFFLGIFASILFPGTQFATVIEDTVGKFFNLADFFTNNYLAIIETITVMVFIWLIYKAL